MTSPWFLVGSALSHFLAMDYRILVSGLPSGLSIERVRKAIYCSVLSVIWAVFMGRFCLYITSLFGRG